jgi:anti-sigma regulatory factor (Ser/Thr protein kinase)
MREGTVPLGPTAVMDPRSAATSWPVSSSLALGALRTASPCGRLHARAVLAEWGLRDLAETAELIVSELVTNAVRASTGPDGRPRHGEAGLPVVILRLTTDAARVLIEVWDDILAAPVAEQAGPEDESGRGLMLIEAVCDRWWWEVVPGWTGKVVSAELRIPVPKTAHDQSGPFPATRGVAADGLPL